MTHSSANRVGACAATALVLALAASPSAAAAPTLSELPDWTGIWQILGPPLNTGLFDGGTSDPYGCNATNQPCRMHPPYTAEYEAKYVEALKHAADGTLPDPLTNCLPRPTPGNMRSPDAMEFVVRPERVWLFIENGSQVRHIYTDGRGHRTGKDAVPSYTGDSIGHWEGDTLVVETTNMRGESMMDRSGAELSSKAKITERIRRIDKNTMQDDFTIEDPGALTAVWHVQRKWRLVPNVRIFDYACAENNRNPIDETGRTRTVDTSGKVID